MHCRERVGEINTFSSSSYASEFSLDGMTTIASTLNGVEEIFRREVSRGMVSPFSAAA